MSALTINPSNHAELEARATGALRSKFQREPDCLASAPGRVNLIGEHVDYEGGLVLPMAIDRHTVIAASASPAPRLRIWSELGSGTEEIDLTAPMKKNEDHWTNYIKGIVAQFNRLGVHVGGLDAAIVSNLPAGAGLSSSAALEVAFCLVLESLTNHPLTARHRAKLAQAAEHEMAGVPCGIMDQIAVTHAREGHAMLIDCRSLEVEQIALPGDIHFVVLDTRAKHALTDGEYSRRRSECAAAGDILGVTKLRDATPLMVEEQRAKLGEKLYPRALHVAAEIQRVQQFVEALAQDDRKSMGWLLHQSHASLRDNFEVSCRELNKMRKLASKMEGTIGARMTGAGFGGSVIALCESPDPKAVDRILREYGETVGRVGAAHLVKPAGAARIVATSATA